MQLDLLEKFLAEKGIKATICSEYHLQVRQDGFIFNIYPTRQTLFINGAKKSIKFLNPDHLIQIINREINFEYDGKKDRRKISYKNSKLKLWNKGKRVCFVCGLPITDINNASVDHKIPLAMGGANQFDNYALTHKACNNKKGSDFRKNTHDV